MPVQDKFEVPIAYDPTGGEGGEGALVKGAEFTVHAPDDTSFSTPLAVTDPATGVAIVPLRSSTITGVLPDFRVAGDLPEVLLRSGTFVTRLTSKFGVFLQAGFDPEQIAAAVAAAGAAADGASAAEDARVMAEAAKAAAESAAAAAEAVGATNDEIMTNVAGGATGFRAFLDTKNITDIRDLARVAFVRSSDIGPDWAATMQSVVDAVPAGTTVWSDAGTFMTRATLTIDYRKNLKMVLTGTTVVSDAVRDGSGAVVLGSDGRPTRLPVILLTGVYAPQVAVSAISYTERVEYAATPQITTVTVPAGHGISRGDKVKLLSDDIDPYARRVIGNPAQPRMGYDDLEVLDAGATWLVLSGHPQDKELYTLNVRVAKKYRGGFSLEGGTFDVTDEVFDGEWSAGAVVRLDGGNPRVDDVEFARAVGPMLQWRGTTRGVYRNLRFVRGINNEAAARFTYGAHGVGGRKNLVDTFTSGHLRHGIDFTQADVVAGSAATHLYGPAYDDEAENFTAESGTEAPASTHHGARGTRFRGIRINGNSKVDAVKIRGLRVSIDDLICWNVRNVFYPTTENNPGYLNGETSGLNVSKVEVYGAERIFLANQRRPPHPAENVRNPKAYLKIDGLYAEGVRAIGEARNAGEVAIGNSEIYLAANPAKVLVNAMNSGVRWFGANLLDGMAVTEADANSALVRTSLEDTLRPEVPSARVAIEGNLMLRFSPYYRGRFPGGLIQTDPVLNAAVEAGGPAPVHTEVSIPTDESLVLDGFFPGGVVRDATKVLGSSVVGWEYVSVPGDTGSMNSSGFMTWLHAEISANDTTVPKLLMLSPSKHLRLTLILTAGLTLFNASRQMPPGRRKDVLLSILNGSGGAYTATVNDGNGLALASAPVSLTQFRQKLLSFTGTSWRDYS